MGDLSIYILVYERFLNYNAKTNDKCNEYEINSMICRRTGILRKKRTK